MGPKGLPVVVLAFLLAARGGVGTASVCKVLDDIVNLKGHCRNQFVAHVEVGTKLMKLSLVAGCKGSAGSRTTWISASFEIDGSSGTGSTHCTYDARLTETDVTMGKSPQPHDTKFKVAGTCALMDPEKASGGQDFRNRHTFWTSELPSCLNVFEVTPQYVMYQPAVCQKVDGYFLSPDNCTQKAPGTRVSVDGKGVLAFDLPDCKTFSQMRMTVTPKFAYGTNHGDCSYDHDAVLTGSHGGEAISQKFSGNGWLKGPCASPFPGSITMQDVKSHMFDYTLPKGSCNDLIVFKN